MCSICKNSTEYGFNSKAKGLSDMSTITRVALGFVLTIGVLGCGHHALYRNGQPADPAQLRVHSLACEREAATTYPFAQVISVTGGGSSSSSNTVCTPGSYGSLSCNTTGGFSTPAAVNTADGNAENRQRFYANCLAVLGYHEVFISNDRSRTTAPRARPDSFQSEGTCRSPSDCPSGQSCRTIPGSGGRTECRK